MILSIQRILKETFFADRLYLFLAGVAFVALLSYTAGFLFPVAMMLLVFLMLCLLVDMILLFSVKVPLRADRIMSERFSNGDENKIELKIKNGYPFQIQLQVLDEVPDQFQIRDFSLKARMAAGEEQSLNYTLRPVQRGEYFFHAINLLVKSPLKLVIRRVIVVADKRVAVFPSFHSVKKYSLMAMNANLSEYGSQKIRKLGHSLEFEQIKEYVSGDDVRSINWKATARKGGNLMVNHFTDERSQQVYCVIDKSRVMKMPFDGMTLLDYAINASLILSQVALVRHDKAGLISFDEDMGSVLAADNKAIQMSRIMETLYSQQTNFRESDFEKLHALIRSRITHRSLVILFTNFESLSGLDRQLPFIRSIARNHLVLVVFFENAGLKEITETTATDMEQLYIRTIAEKFAMEKRLMVKELRKYGILSLLTPPKQVTVSIVNKYLELKARQQI